jgi:hypothetical protein
MSKTPSTVQTAPNTANGQASVKAARATQNSPIAIVSSGGLRKAMGMMLRTAGV